MQTDVEDGERTGAEVRLRLLARMAEDVQMRSGPVDAAAWLVFDAGSTGILREIMDQHGWPGRSLVGEDGATAAWLSTPRTLPFKKAYWTC